MPRITYTILAGRTPVAREVIDAVEDLEVEAQLGMADILRLRLAVALSSDGSRWSIIDDDVFPRLASLQLLVTIGAGPPAVAFDGHVVETTAELSEDSERCSLTVVAMDATALMNLEEKVREWPNMPDSAIARLIFAEHGLLPVVDSTQPARPHLDTTVIQRDTDIRFLRHLAHRNGFDVYLRATAVPGVVQGHFRLPRLDRPPQGVLSVAMGEATNVRTLTARHDMLRPTAAGAAGVDARTVEHQLAEVATGQLTTLGRRALLNGDRPRRTLLTADGLSQTGELQTLAQAAVDRSAWAVSVDGELETALYGQLLRVAAPILVRGAGPTYSGAYLVERVLHKIQGERYTQHFTLRRNALKATGAEVYLPSTGLPLQPDRS